MSKAKIADRKPKRVTLEPGVHHWCSCGRSSAQPMCDGSHRGTDFEPLAFEAEAKEEAHLCRDGAPFPPPT